MENYYPDFFIRCVEKILKNKGLEDIRVELFLATSLRFWRNIY